MFLNILKISVSTECYNIIQYNTLYYTTLQYNKYTLQYNTITLFKLVNKFSLKLIYKFSTSNLQSLIKIGVKMLWQDQICDIHRTVVLTSITNKTAHLTSF